MSKKKKTFRAWLRGLAVAAGGGVAVAVFAGFAAVAADPHMLASSAYWAGLGAAALGAIGTTGGAYLLRSPLTAVLDEDTDPPTVPPAAPEARP